MMKKTQAVISAPLKLLLNPSEDSLEALHGNEARIQRDMTFQYLTRNLQQLSLYLLDREI